MTSSTHRGSDDDWKGVAALLAAARSGVPVDFSALEEDGEGTELLGLLEAYKATGSKKP
jgi:hypothetical protein